MSILTKEERTAWQERAEKGVKNYRFHRGKEYWSDQLMLRALATIDALEAHVEVLESQVEIQKEWRRRYEALKAELEAENAKHFHDWAAGKAWGSE